MHHDCTIGRLTTEFEMEFNFEIPLAPCSFVSQRLSARLCGESNSLES